MKMPFTCHEAEACTWAWSRIRASSSRRTRRRMPCAWPPTCSRRAIEPPAHLRQDLRDQAAFLAETARRRARDSATLASRERSPTLRSRTGCTARRGLRCHETEGIINYAHDDTRRCRGHTVPRDGTSRPQSRSACVHAAASTSTKSPSISAAADTRTRPAARIRRKHPLG